MSDKYLVQISICIEYFQSMNDNFFALRKDVTSFQNTKNIKVNVHLILLFGLKCIKCDIF